MRKNNSELDILINQVHTMAEAMVDLTMHVKDLSDRVIELERTIVNVNHNVNGLYVDIQELERRMDNGDSGEV
jgi:chromosome segregation ATPase